MTNSTATTQSSTVLKPLLVVLMSLVLVSGCAVRITYPFLDWMLYWGLEDYVDFSRDQKKQVKAAIKDFHQWHRYEELSAAADDLAAMAAAIQNPVTPEQVSIYSEKMLEGWRRIMLQIARPTAEVMSTFTDEQIAALEKKLLEDETDDRKDYAEESPEDRLADRVELMQGVAEKIAGKLRPDQIERISTWAGSLQETSTMAADHAAQWRQRLREALALRDDVDALESAITPLFAYPDNYWSDDYRAALEHNRKLTDALVADLINSLDEKQRKRAVRRLETWSRDFRALSKERD